MDLWNRTIGWLFPSFAFKVNEEDVPQSITTILGTFFPLTHSNKDVDLVSCDSDLVRKIVNLKYWTDNSRASKFSYGVFHVKLKKPNKNYYLVSSTCLYEDGSSLADSVNWKMKEIPRNFETVLVYSYHTEDFLMHCTTFDLVLKLEDGEHIKGFCQFVTKEIDESLEFQMKIEFYSPDANIQSYGAISAMDVPEEDKKQAMMLYNCAEEEIQFIHISFGAKYKSSIASSKPTSNQRKETCSKNSELMAAFLNNYP